MTCIGPILPPWGHFQDNCPSPSEKGVLLPPMSGYYKVCQKDRAHPEKWPPWGSEDPVHRKWQEFPLAPLQLITAQWYSTSS